MNKIYATCLMLVLTLSVANAQRNLFDAADVDANGWIWFDSQSKIDKYIGQSDNENAKYNESGKLIQLVSAGFGDYLDSEVSVEFKGAGTDGVLAGTGALSGAIKLAAASSTSSTNGGGIIVKLPSCTSFNLCLSADSKMLVRLLGASQSDKIMSDYTIVSAKYSTIFKYLSSAGIYNWTGMEQLNSGYEPIFTYASSSTRYAYIQNLTKNNLYIHGMKILTAAAAVSGLNEYQDDSFVMYDGRSIKIPHSGEITLYNVQGGVVRSVNAADLSVEGVSAGVYLTRVCVAGSMPVYKKIIIH